MNRHCGNTDANYPPSLSRSPFCSLTDLARAAISMAARVGVACSPRVADAGAEAGMRAQPTALPAGVVGRGSRAVPSTARKEEASRGVVEAEGRREGDNEV